MKVEYRVTWSLAIAEKQGVEWDGFTTINGRTSHYDEVEPQMSTASCHSVARAIADGVIQADEGKLTINKGFVYFLQEEGKDAAIKIGTTARSPKDRVNDLQSGNWRKFTVIGAIPGGYALEQKLHKKFASSLLGGEWYRPTPELLAFIEGANLAAPGFDLLEERIEDLVKHVAWLAEEVERLDMFRRMVSAYRKVVGHDVLVAIDAVTDERLRRRAAIYIEEAAVPQQPSEEDASRINDLYPTTPPSPKAP